jgi:hypothetical protein
MAAEAVRQADIYVFALLAHEDKATVNSLDVAQWDFYVLTSNTLNRRTASRQSITLKEIKTLADGPVRYEELAAAVRSALPSPPGK